jgi:hypothetical protein
MQDYIDGYTLKSVIEGGVPIKTFKRDLQDLLTLPLFNKYTHKVLSIMVFV